MCNPVYIPTLNTTGAGIGWVGEGGTGALFIGGQTSIEYFQTEALVASGIRRRIGN